MEAAACIFYTYTLASPTLTAVAVERGGCGGGRQGQKVENNDLCRVAMHGRRGDE